MREILLINNRSKPTGIGNYAHQLLHHLRQSGCTEVDLLNLRSLGEDSYGSTLRVFIQKTRRILDHLMFIYGIPNNYKIYHLLNPNLGILLLKCRPSVVTVHDLFPFTPASKDVIIQSYGLDASILLAMRANMGFVTHADRVISVSQNTKEDLIVLFGISAKKIKVVYHGVDRKKFSPRDKRKTRLRLGLPIDKKIVLHVGVDEPRKNVKTLVEAFCRVSKKLPETLLLRIGGMRNTTKRQVSTLGLENKVLHLRKVADIAPFYNAADLLVYPSYYEGFGLPLLEAMASGCPLIASNVSSIPEVVGSAAKLFSPSDSTTLSEIIYEVLTNADIQSEMTTMGLERSCLFSWETCAKETMAVYKTLL